MIGSTIGSYRITGQLGEGGMGAVYRAIDNIEREVAIKALHSQLTRDESRLARFRAEAVALGRLHHPNIAGLYHLLEQDGNYYMVMEYVQGQTLEDIVRIKGALTPEMALAVFADGLKGFEHAHTRGVIHRDIKPSNIMVSNEGITKITDFGIARMAGSGRMTQTGKVIGTLEYMSPEQVRGLEQDARSDIYSLGILLFELLTGRMPFTATSDYEIMRAHLEEVPPPARSIVATLPAGLDSIIAKALAKDPSARFQTVAEMRHAIEAIARELPPPAPAQTLLAPPEAAPAPTRQVVLPTSLPGTSQAPVPQQAPQQPTSNPYPSSYPPPTNVPSAPPVRAANPIPKWAVPASLGFIAVVLVGGVLAFSGGRKGTPTPTPLPAPTQQVIAENSGTTENGTSGNGSSTSNAGESGTTGQGSSGTDVTSQVLPLVKTPAPTPDTSNIKIPDSIPGFSDPTPVPDEPTPVPTKRAVESRPSVQPTPRRRERVVTTQPRPRKPRVRVVERPRPRVATRPKTRVRVREVTQRRPPRTVARPTRRRASGGGGGEAAALRALIKGG